MKMHRRPFNVAPLSILVKREKKKKKADKPVVCSDSVEAVNSESG